VWAVAYQKHYFGYTKQYRQRKYIEQTLVSGELAILLDFSKAYECEAFHKIQQGFFSSAKVGILPLILTFLDNTAGARSTSSSPPSSSSSSSSFSNTTSAATEPGSLKKVVIYNLTNTLESDPAVIHASLQYAIELARKTLGLTVTKVHVFSDKGGENNCAENYSLCRDTGNEMDVNIGWHFSWPMYGKGLADAAGGLIEKT